VKIGALPKLLESPMPSQNDRKHQMSNRSTNSQQSKNAPGSQSKASNNDQENSNLTNT